LSERKWEEVLPPERWAWKKPPSRYRCKDGHLVRSRLEQIVDDILFSHNTLHEYEPKIPDTNLRADFKVRHDNEEWYIEIWGTEGSPEYDAKRHEKIDYYNKRKLNLIQISSKYEAKQKLDLVLGPGPPILDLKQLTEALAMNREIQQIDSAIEDLQKRIDELTIKRNEIVNQIVKRSMIGADKKRM
jgi:predicted nuclease of restriction endonuclease-like RecB superfamily